MILIKHLPKSTRMLVVLRQLILRDFSVITFSISETPFFIGLTPLAHCDTTNLTSYLTLLSRLAMEILIWKLAPKVIVNTIPIFLMIEFQLEA